MPLPERFRSDPYRGPLTIEEAVEGVRLCDRNAKELVREAEILYRNKRWARSIALSVLAIEESGKFIPIIMAAVAPEPTVLKRVWRMFVTHTDKTFRAQQILGNKDSSWGKRVRGAKAVKKALPGKSDGTTEVLVERAKETCLYVDAIQGSTRWRAPSDAIQRVDAQAMLHLAKHAVGSGFPPMANPRVVALMATAMKEGWVRGENSNQWAARLVGAIRKAAKEGIVPQALADSYQRRLRRWTGQVIA